MREQFQDLSIEGQNVRLTVREPLRLEPRMLALAAALRIFEQYTVLDRLTLTARDVEVVVSRAEVTRLLGREGFAALKDRTQYRQILSRGLPDEEAAG